MGRRLANYELGRALGSGSYAKVVEATDCETGKVWAIKFISRRQTEGDGTGEQLKREVALMKHLEHENVLGLREVLLTSRYVCVVLEHVPNGDLLNHIINATCIDENTGRRYFQELIGGVRHCHERGVAHRDLKPENLLIDTNGTLKISDFGLSNYRCERTILHAVCGTPNYMAPEVLEKRGYNGLAADMWSCGVVLFVMLAGRLPFDEAERSTLFSKVKRGEYLMSPRLSDGARDLLKKLLVVNPTDRLTADGVTRHPWFRVGLCPSRLPPLSSYSPLRSDSTSVGAVGFEDRVAGTVARLKVLNLDGDSASGSVRCSSSVA